MAQVADVIKAATEVSFYVKQIWGPIVQIKLPLSSPVAAIKSYIKMVGDTTPDQLFFCYEDVILYDHKELLHYNISNEDCLELLVQTKVAMLELSKLVRI